MANGKACCILAVCCKRASQGQIDALAAEMVKDGLCDMEHALTHSAWTLKHFDLLPAGTIDLTGVAHAIREHDRGKKD